MVVVVADIAFIHSFSLSILISLARSNVIFSHRLHRTSNASFWYPVVRTHFENKDIFRLTNAFVTFLVNINLLLFSALFFLSRLLWNEILWEKFSLVAHCTMRKRQRWNEWKKKLQLFAGSTTKHRKAAIKRIANGICQSLLLHTFRNGRWRRSKWKRCR